METKREKDLTRPITVNDVTYPNYDKYAHSLLISWYERVIRLDLMEYIVFTEGNYYLMSNDYKKWFDTRNGILLDVEEIIEGENSTLIIIQKNELVRGVKKETYLQELRNQK